VRSSEGPQKLDEWWISEADLFPPMKLITVFATKAWSRSNHDRDGDYTSVHSSHGVKRQKVASSSSKLPDTPKGNKN
jgi:hypothetical protein